jgi:hypothetical protein
VMCVLVQKKCCTYVAELRVNMLKDNIKMYIKQTALETKQTELNLVLILRSQLSVTIFDGNR